MRLEFLRLLRFSHFFCCVGGTDKPADVHVLDGLFFLAFGPKFFPKRVAFLKNVKREQVARSWTVEVQTLLESIRIF